MQNTKIYIKFIKNRFETKYSKIFPSGDYVYRMAIIFFLSYLVKKKLIKLFLQSYNKSNDNLPSHLRKHGFDDKWQKYP